MTSPSARAGRTNLPARIAAVAAVLVFVVAGCSTSGTRKLDSADLSKAMPTAQDIGANFHRDKAGEKDTSGDADLKVSAKCKKLLNSDDTGKQKATRNYTDDKQREVDLTATVSKATLSSVVDAAKSCKRVPFTNGDAKGVVAFKVRSMGGVGDDAEAVDLVLTITSPISLTLKGHGVLAKPGDIGMSVIGFDGINDQAAVTPIDNATVDNAARALDQNIKDAQS